MRVDAAVAHRRRPSWARAAVRFVEACRSAMAPDEFAGRQLVARDVLVVTALLLRVDEIAADRKRRPAGTDRLAPDFHRRRFRPIGFDLHAANDAVALWTA